MDEIRVASWTELHEAVYRQSWNDRLSRFRSPYAFRGVSDLHYSLVPSLSRLGGDPRELERHLLRAFRRYAYRDVVERDSYWYWLATGQHHGLPTRLLDWSYSPLVAMHFATADPSRFDCDGVIWMVNYAETNARLPPELGSFLAEEGSDVFTVDLLASFSQHYREGDAPDSAMFDVQALEKLEARSREPFLLFFEPPSLDERIVQQYALFSLLSDPRDSMEAWLEQCPQAYTKIVLPAEVKWEVRDKLDQANVTERTLFPGLSGLSTWLRRYYTPRAEFPEASNEKG
ncbi:FRG domain-containing protein [Deinococcus peraridilitoris]|uniref:FRG domain protein n=1 Tax=Deinococcus peraridilitoris (strain DSM 19664 / LMG 22246 / CIP 109416 / KR-200) TaxID=937777 RepID=L0A2J9_DEIPD|nr:FRG domain-containing protein [Deinococcus peraridilitoris]AFZ68093.1 FRG domain protein [Deinococcus peraridilitoris DSM 19664]